MFTTNIKYKKGCLLLETLNRIKHIDITAGGHVSNATVTRFLSNSLYMSR